LLILVYRLPRGHRQGFGRAQKANASRENLRLLRQALQLEKKVGQRLEQCPLLLEALPPPASLKQVILSRLPFLCPHLPFSRPH